MQKIALKCDVCGGPLTMQSGGQMAVCEYCGTRYALERLREKVQEIRGKVSIEGPVKTSHEDFEIHAGVLTKYHGADTEIKIPKNVKEIASDCFKVGRNLITSVTLPEGLTRIDDGVFLGFANLKQIALPNSVTSIGNGAFQDCTSLQQITLPNGVASIGPNAFLRCTSLKKINIPDSVTEIGGGAFWNCAKLKDVILSSATCKRLCPKIKDSYSWEWSAFSNVIITPYGPIVIQNFVIGTSRRVSFTSDEFIVNDINFRLIYGYTKRRSRSVTCACGN